MTDDDTHLRLLILIPHLHQLGELGSRVRYI